MTTKQTLDQLINSGDLYVYDDKRHALTTAADLLTRLNGRKIGADEAADFIAAQHRQIAFTHFLARLKAHKQCNKATKHAEAYRKAYNIKPLSI